MPKGLFVTGTDTRVGKTMVAGALAAWAHHHGIRVGVMKPVETGIPAAPGGRELTDARFLGICAGGGQEPNELNLYSFRLPAAPSVSSRAENRRISIPRIKRAVNALSKRYSMIIVEGAGGLHVPISGRYTMADLAKDLSMPVILVAGNKLGAINHTILSIDCLLQMKIKIAGIIFNTTAPGGGIAEKSNPETVRRLRPGLPYLGTLPYDKKLNKNFPDAAALLDWLAEAAPRKIRSLFFT